MAQHTSHRFRSHRAIEQFNKNRPVQIAFDGCSISDKSDFMCERHKSCARVSGGRHAADTRNNEEVHSVECFGLWFTELATDGDVNDGGDADNVTKCACFAIGVPIDDFFFHFHGAHCVLRKCEFIGDSQNVLANGNVNLLGNMYMYVYANWGCCLPSVWCFSVITNYHVPMTNGR